MEKILEIRSKTKEEAIKNAVVKLGVEEKDLQIEELQAPTKGFLGIIGAKEGLYKIRVIQKEVIKTEIVKKETDIARDFIKTILRNTNIEADINVSQKDNLIKVDIKGQEAASLIGRRGETLDSIQLLTGLALNKVNKNSNKRVLVDIENYRSKREESLIKYGKKVAREVMKTKKTKRLEYMNPYERRIIHSALQHEKNINTYSEGTDPYRRLVIEYVR